MGSGRETEVPDGYKQVDVLEGYFSTPVEDNRPIMEDPAPPKVTPEESDEEEKEEASKPEKVVFTDDDTKVTTMAMSPDELPTVSNLP